MREATNQEKLAIEQAALKGKKPLPSFTEWLFINTFVYGSLFFFGFLIWKFFGLFS